MSEASQSKLLNDASDLRKSLGRARDVLRGMQTEREVALTRLSKLRNEAAARQLRADEARGDCAKVEAQVAKLDAEIKGLSDMLTQFSGLSAKVTSAPPAVAAPASSRVKTVTKAAASTVRTAPEDAAARRRAIVEACTVKPRTMPELREAFPKITALNLRPMISLMVKSGLLKMTGTYGSYMYSPGPKAGTEVSAPSVSKSTPSLKQSDDRSLRASILKMVLAGPPRRSADFYSIFPKARHHTIQSALSSLFDDGKIDRTKAQGNQFLYCALKTKQESPAKDASAASVTPQAAPAQRGHAENVLALCKTPMPFGEIAKKMSDVNRHVLHQTVHALVNSKRLRRSGKRNEYVYATV